MADDWRLKAAHEQFNIFDTLSVQNITCTTPGEVLNQVNTIKENHLRWPNITLKPTKNLAAEIIKSCVSHEFKNNFTFSFAVIVSNKKNGNQLCKMPIFVIKKGNETTFIDLNCLDYQSWNLFLQKNNLPSCEFCFPVDGLYIVGGKLKIDFAKNTVAIWKNNLFRVGACTLLCAGAVISCFFFKVAPTTVETLSNLLLPIAEKFLLDVHPLLRMVARLITISCLIRQGNVSVLVHMAEVFRILNKIHTEYNEHINNALESAKDAMKKAFDYLCKTFKRFFESVRKAEKFRFFAIANRTDAIIRMLMSDSKNQVNAAIKPDASVNNVKEIFENSKTECAFSMNETKYDEFHPFTRTVLEISKNMYDTLKSETLTDQDVFEAFSSIVMDEYKKHVESYTKILNNLVLLGRMSLKEINLCLGIEGNFQEYFWKKAIQSAMELRIGLKMKEKLEDFKHNKKLTLIKLASCQSTGDFYVCVGKQVGIPISTEDFLNMLSENEIYVDENDVITTETENKFILSDEYVIALEQSFDNESVAEGFVFIQRKEA